jgi:hypothetical protein
MIYMNVMIRIDYITNENMVTQRGSFPSKRRTPEKVAYDWWREIKRGMRYDCQLEKVIVDNEDLTEKVKELEEAPLN